MAKVDVASAKKFERDSYDVAIKDVQDKSVVVEDIIKEIVEPYCTGIDNLIEEVRKVLYDTNSLTDSELDTYIAKIPIQLYYLNEQMTSIETKENVSKVSHKIAYNEARLDAVGTVADKDAIAERAVEQRTLVNLIFTQARKSLQSKRDIALELLNSLKKISSRRISEYEMTRFSERS